MARAGPVGESRVSEGRTKYAWGLSGSWDMCLARSLQEITAAYIPKAVGVYCFAEDSSPLIHEISVICGAWLAEADTEKLSPKVAPRTARHPVPHPNKGKVGRRLVGSTLGC